MISSTRYMLLEANSYQVTETELVGWEHSMKNEFIVGEYTGQPRWRALPTSSTH